MQIKKWYFAINENGVQNYEYMIKTAVYSCYKFTDLIPCCIYYGEETELTHWLRANGVFIVNHSSSFLETINSTPDNVQWKSSTATGAYLRLDIPLIEKDEEFVLYTDVDVIFCRSFAYQGKPPKFFSCAPEMKLGDWSFFNSGSMIINVPQFRSVFEAFSDFVRPRLATFYKKGRGTYDQGALNAFFSKRWDRMPLEYNWKPYWGVNNNANIVHFHGPKPNHIRKIVLNDFEHIPLLYREIYNINPDGYKYFMATFSNLEKNSVIGNGWGRI
ncbi:MAG: hypothetical protein NTV73_07785 [Hyphomicrobiales bacterium]|nr:hypothetical protein [Hyphomicrobiales bacterium]